MLEEYKDTFAALAGVISVAQMFSGAFICKDIYKKGSSTGIPGMPFIGGTGISILFFQHGLLQNDKALGVVNFIGIAINILYVIFYYAYCNAKERTDYFKQMGTATGIVALLIGYSKIENPEVVAFRFGTIVTILLMLLISSPLFKIKTILREKDTSMIPLPMVITGCAMATTWLLYGLAANQNFIIFQNVIGLLISVPQLILCYLFPTKIEIPDKKRK